MSLIEDRSKKIGLSPGSLVYTGDKKGKVKISVFEYNEKKYKEREAKNIEECFPSKSKSKVTWININGIQDTSIVEKIGKRYGIHPLVLEDIVTPGQRPRIEDFGKHIFIVFKMLEYNERYEEIEPHQLSIILGPNFVITFTEGEGDSILDVVRERIRKKKGLVRSRRADYLMYRLMDTVIDKYFIILEKLGEKIELVEKELIKDPRPQMLGSIYKLKRNMIFLRRSIWPLRELIAHMEREACVLIERKTYPYIMDLYDHIILIIDELETLRDTLSEILEIYLSSISNKLNEIMKVLTMIATVFIPLTFVVGVYGMNFKYMPELEWRLGYLAIWVVIIIISAIIVAYFKKKGWV